MKKGKKKGERMSSEVQHGHRDTLVNERKKKGVKQLTVCQKKGSGWLGV